MAMLGKNYLFSHMQVAGLRTLTNVDDITVPQRSTLRYPSVGFKDLVGRIYVGKAGSLIETRIMIGDLVHMFHIRRQGCMN